jgi:hypothetical protein
MAQNDYLTCNCLHCGQKIEFSAPGVGQSISCPTCGKQTMLHVQVRSVTALRPKSDAWGVTANVIKLLALVLIGLAILSQYTKQKQNGVFSEKQTTERHQDGRNEEIIRSLQRFSKALETGVNRSEFNQCAIDAGVQFDRYKARAKTDDLIKKEIDSIELNVRYANRLANESPMGWSSDGISKYFGWINEVCKSMISDLKYEQ